MKKVFKKQITDRLVIFFVFLFIIVLLILLVRIVNSHRYNKRLEEIKKVLNVKQGDNLKEVFSYVIKEGMTYEELKHKLKPLEKLSFVEVIEHREGTSETFICYIFDMGYMLTLGRDGITIEIDRGKVKKFHLEDSL